MGGEWKYATGYNIKTGDPRLTSFILIHLIKEIMEGAEDLL